MAFSFHDVCLLSIWNAGVSGARLFFLYIPLCMTELRIGPTKEQLMIKFFVH